MDRSASAGFEGIAQMLLEQKKLMDALEAENRELRRQLSDLRRGIGIAVVIEGKTIQLATEMGNPSPGFDDIPHNPGQGVPTGHDRVCDCSGRLAVLLDSQVHVPLVRAVGRSGHGWRARCFCLGFESAM